MNKSKIKTNKNIINQDMATERLAICEVCDKYKVHDILPNTCSICGCIMKIKTLFPVFHCPINKW